MNDTEVVAHLAKDGRFHGLEEHLRGTAELAALFAAEFGCGREDGWVVSDIIWGFDY